MKTNKNSTNYMNFTLKIKQQNYNVSTTSGRDSLKCSQRRVNNFLIVFTDVLITIWSERELNSLIIYKIVSFEFCPSQIQFKTQYPLFKWCFAEWERGYTNCKITSSFKFETNSSWLKSLHESEQCNVIVFWILDTQITTNVTAWVRSSK